MLTFIIKCIGNRNYVIVHVAIFSELKRVEIYFPGNFSVIIVRVKSNKYQRVLVKKKRDSSFDTTVGFKGFLR